MTTENSKWHRKRETVKNRVRDYIAEGDYQSLDDLISGLITIRDGQAALESMSEISLDAYTDFVDRMLCARRKNRAGTEILHTVHEMLLRAMSIDFQEYMKITKRFPIAAYSESLREATKDIRSKMPSFADKDNRQAKDLFATYYENYKKLCMTFSDISDIVSRYSDDQTRKWKSPFPDSNSRYHCMAPSKTDMNLRHAIQHKSVTRSRDGKITLLDKRGRLVGSFTPKYLDSRLQDLWWRTIMCDLALSLASHHQNQMLILAVRSQRRRRTSKKRKGV